MSYSQAEADLLNAVQQKDAQIARLTAERDEWKRLYDSRDKHVEFMESKMDEPTVKLIAELASLKSRLEIAEKAAGFVLSLRTHRLVCQSNSGDGISKCDCGLSALQSQLREKK